MDNVIVTGVLVFNPEGKVLLVKKPDGVGPYPGTLLTPGGGVETDESIDTAAIRELYEETGVVVSNLTRIYFDDDFTGNWKGVEKHFIMLLYTAQYVSGDLKPTSGDDDNLEIISWYSPDEVEKLILSPPLSKLLKLIKVKHNRFLF
ncbi:NUDIX hydrolase [Candidatus Woesebacteria bacterium]|nr:NUDIX hydrolase [Candidatus Woesebacteria bacterium]